MRTVVRSVGVASLLAFSCGHGATTPPVAGGPASAPADPESTFGPLEVGADFATYQKVSTAAFPSRTHGGRFVEVWVNAVGADAYQSDAPVPEGSVVVKTSKETVDGKPTDVDGPIFVMRKEKTGYAPEHGDWSFALHWAKPTPQQAAAFGGPVYWRGKSPKVGYCWKCHDNYDRDLGGVPDAFRARK